MKKSNIIVYSIMVAASIFLLWEWYHLGLHEIDNPLDLIVSVIWWIVIAAAIFTVVKVEQRRKAAIRTVYVAESRKEIFNSEIGTIAINEPENLIDTVSTIISDLKYDFNKSGLPSRAEFNPRYLIHTHKLTNSEWEGEVVNTWTKEQTVFNNREELIVAIAAQTS